MKKYFIIIILVISFPMVNFTQTLNVHNNDGTVQSFLIDNIDSITFTATYLFPENGLIAYYPFNGNANDESGNGKNGIVLGAALTTDRFGSTNKAYTFDGVNDAIKLEDWFN
ncbi:MAG: hypothetical protein PVH88_18035 [Ignavibacteria bacterium]|jgi:hypothetical protein